MGMYDDKVAKGIIQLLSIGTFILVVGFALGFALGRLI